MRVRKKDRNNFFKVGIFLASLLCVLMIMIASIGKENSIFDPKVEVRARVESVSSLKEGSYVELKGIKIGTVSNIEIISEDEVEITMTILKRELKWIRKDSKVSLSTAGLVGDKFIEIYKGTKDAGQFEPEKDYLTSEHLADFKKILNKGESIAAMTERILTKVDQFLFNLEDGKKIIESVDSINRASSHLEAVSLELKKAQMGKMVSSMTKASTSMTKILTRIEEGPGTMNSLIYDDGLHDDLRALLGGAQRNKVIKYFIRESIKKSEEKKKE